MNNDDGPASIFSRRAISYITQRAYKSIGASILLLIMVLPGCRNTSSMHGSGKDPEIACEESKVVLERVRQNEMELHDISPIFRSDREVVLAAIQQNGWALLYADPCMQADREVVLAAVQQTGWALKYIDPK